MRHATVLVGQAGMVRVLLVKIMIKSLFGKYEKDCLKIDYPAGSSD
jgi:hypothetical protein